jgi:alpha-galactosidase
VLLKTIILISLLFFTVPIVLDAKRKGDVGKLPALGFNSWNAFHCDIDETKFLAAAKKMVDLGLKVSKKLPLTMARDND